MIFHLALPEDWERARRDGVYTVSTRGVPIREQGFMHAASSREQAQAVRAAFYADRSDALLLAMDEEGLRDAGLEVRVEPGDPADPESELFPHVYGGSVPTVLMTPLDGGCGPVLRPW